jgi:hypothetical protein
MQCFGETLLYVNHRQGFRGTVRILTEQTNNLDSKLVRRGRPEVNVPGHVASYAEPP